MGYCLFILKSYFHRCCEGFTPTFDQLLLYDFVFQNIAPAHLPDIIIFLDAIAIVFEEASKGGPPFSLPIASIETGNGHSLPNLPLRFVLCSFSVFC